MGKTNDGKIDHVQKFWAKILAETPYNILQLIGLACV
jgi:hypothetical protein